MSALSEKNSHVWERDEFDWYVEPEAATDALLSMERFVGRVIDPCCGGGNIVRSLIRAGIDAVGADIVRRVPGGTEWFAGESDFLTADTVAFFGISNVVFNPPFFRAKGAEACIRHALSLAPAKVAAFVDVRFLAGAERARGLFFEHPPARIWIITPRVSCPPGAYLAAGNKAGNGSSDWCWLVWDQSAPKATTQFGWLKRAPEKLPEAAE